jgi:signal transduction histidine kinase/ligand-binding sensor domain-containing protein
MKNIAFLLVGLMFCVRALSMDPDRTLAQLNHKAWRVAEGAPSGAPGIAQTIDGTLWFGSSAGLFRFDGLRFTAVTAPWQIPFLSNSIQTLTASPDGGLWIGFHWEGVSYFKDGKVDRYGFREGIGGGTVERILIDDHGTVWVAGYWGLARKQGSRFERVAFDVNDPHSPAWSVLQDRAGTLWVLGQNGVFARLAGATDFRQMASRPYKDYAVAQSLAEAPDGAVWAALVDGRGLLRLDSPTDPQPVGNRLVPVAEASILIFDRDGNLWFDAKAGMGRITSTALKANLNEQQLANRAEYFTPAPGLGLTGDANYYLEDREGNLWIATDGGIDRLSPSNVVRVVPPTPSFSANWVLAAGEEGSVIAAVPVNDTESRVLEIRGSTVVSETMGPLITNSFRDADGAVWLNGPAGISKYKNGHFDTTPGPAHAGYNRVSAMTRDSEGAPWVAFMGSTLWRFSDGAWQEAPALIPKLPRQPAVEAAACDARGQLWLGYGRPLVIVNGKDFRILDASNGFNLGVIGAIIARKEHVWVGGELGLVRFDGARMLAIRTETGNPLTEISGLVETAAGDLWANTGVGVVNISRAEIEHAISDPAYRVRYEAFTYSDGVPGQAEPGTESPTIVEASDGRVWFSSHAGLAYIDPAHLRRSTLPPPVTIWSIDTGATQYAATTGDIRLPVHTKSVRISYTAGTLTVPERVQFKYKLEGIDRDWQDAGDRREVALANLGPGRYTFHVIAANNNGTWNSVGASLPFAISPAFYQTQWFYALCALMVLGLLRILYLIRIRQISLQVRGRLEERLAERERIARDLHDTLLQSVQSLIWRLHAAVRQEQSGAMIEQGLERADEVLTEARDRVKHLRSSPLGAQDLMQDMVAFGKEMAIGQSAQFRSTLIGTPRDLHPVAAEEALFIAREALTNAFRHANARQIEAELSYDDAELRLRICDDGSGIDAGILQRGGRDGHWGLLGMRERAGKMHATLTIRSRPVAGTEMDLRIPGRVAYRSKQKTPLRWWRRPSSSELPG